MKKFILIVCVTIVIIAGNVDGQGGCQAPPPPQDRNQDVTIDCDQAHYILEGDWKEYIYYEQTTECSMSCPKGTKLNRDDLYDEDGNKSQTRAKFVCSDSKWINNGSPSDSWPRCIDAEDVDVVTEDADQKTAGLTVTCFPSVTIELDAATVDAYKLDDADLILGATAECDPTDDVTGEAECDGSYDETGGFHKFTLSNPLNCNPTPTYDNGKTTLEWKISRKINVESDAPIRRALCGCIKVSCTYGTSIQALTGTPIVTKEKLLTMVGAEETGTYKVSLGFKNHDFTADFTDATVAQGSFINIEAKVDGTFQNYRIGIFDCFASTKMDVNAGGAKRYPILGTGGCLEEVSYEKTSDKKLVKNSEDNTARFKFKSFTWTGIAKADQKIFVHCSTKVCLTEEESECYDYLPSTKVDCEASQEDRSRRSVVAVDNSYSISAGPLYITSNTASSVPKKLNKTSILPCSLSNGGCEDICVNFEYTAGRVCACEIGRTLLADGVSCRDTQLLRQNAQVSPIVIGSAPTSHVWMLVAAIAIITILNIVGVIVILRRRKNTKVVV